MATLSELISRRITPEAKTPNKSRSEILSTWVHAKSQRPADEYEADIFNFLLANKEVLGIKNVWKFTALVVDGAVELVDDKRLAVEIKFRMNWTKACQAKWQFRRFLKRTDHKPFPVDGGIVFFEEFSADWNRQADSRFLENGWSSWYRGHAEVEGLRLDLLRLRGGKLDAFPIVDAIMAKIETLTDEERNRLGAARTGAGG
jgi:hypothetical protein